MNSNLASQLLSCFGFVGRRGFSGRGRREAVGERADVRRAGNQLLVVEAEILQRQRADDFLAGKRGERLEVELEIFEAHQVLRKIFALDDGMPDDEVFDAHVAAERADDERFDGHLVHAENFRADGIDRPFRDGSEPERDEEQQERDERSRGDREALQQAAFLLGRSRVGWRFVFRGRGVVFVRVHFREILNRPRRNEKRKVESPRP